MYNVSSLNILKFSRLFIQYTLHNLKTEDFIFKMHSASLRKLLIIAYSYVNFKVLSRDPIRTHVKLFKL